MRFVVQLGERGRLVMPAPMRRALGLQAGDQLLLELTGDDVTLTKASAVADSARGMFADDSGRSLAEELLAERRAEAEQEAALLAGR